MADRVALFDQGRIIQIGTPQDIYRRPNSRFVADFVGSSNVLPPDFVVTLVGKRQWASLRPESIRIAESNGHAARVVATSFLGGTTKLALDLEGLRIHALLASISILPEVGERIHINWEPKDLHLMEEDV